MLPLHLYGNLAVTASATVRQRIVYGLCGSGGTSGYICNHLGIEGCICIVDNRIVTAAALIAFSVESHHKLILAAGESLTDELECVHSLLVLYGLIGKRLMNALDFAVEICNDIAELLVGVNLGVTESELLLKCAVLLNEAIS